MENDGFGEVGEAEEGGGGVGSVLRLVGLWGRRGGGVGRCWRLRQNWQRWVPLPSSGGHCHQRGCAEQLVPTNHNMRQIEIIQKDLCDSHEHFGTLHPAVVAPNGDLEDAASVTLVEDELLLEKRVEGASRRRGLRLRQALLPRHQVHFHPRSWQQLGARLALETASANDLDLKVSPLVAQAQLDVPQDRGAEHLATNQLARAKA